MNKTLLILLVLGGAGVAFYLYNKNKVATAVIPSQSLSSNLQSAESSLLASGTSVAGGLITGAGTALSNGLSNLFGGNSNSSGIFMPTDSNSSSYGSS